MPKPMEKIAITASVLSYKDKMLTFKYEDKEYSLPFSRWDFDSDPICKTTLFFGVV